MQNSFFSNLFKNWGWSGWTLVLIFVLSVIPFLSTTVKLNLKELLSPPDRVLLSIVDNKLQTKSKLRQAAKFKTPLGILVEIYGAADEHGQRPLIGHVRIPDLEDAYYHLNSRPTNLALTDLDSDGEPEIIAPSYDKSGQARLNVIRYNPSTDSFELSE